MNKEQFLNETKKLGIDISVDTLSKLDTYYKLLVEENTKYNLTAITEENQVYLKHFYDSLTIIKIINLNNQYLLDIGTGAGFPGLVLKIVFPNLKIDLLDSTNKRCQFLQMVIDKLQLDNINVINARAEEYAKDNREKYDIVTSRAVAPLKHLLEYSIPTLKVNGTFISLKSNIDEELTNINNYYQKLNLTNEKTLKFELPYESSLRTLYKITKEKPTKLIYPRTYSQIKKKDI
jgi:16S rRNA (guanine527-N7)-methyltransferase